LFKSCYELFVDVSEYLGDVCWVSFDKMKVILKSAKYGNKAMMFFCVG
jgi:hypothetical protein